ncbi:low temperature requirement protein A [Micromonospora sp. AMSO31t]|uniref:low temperature requirement protein A n=1 Tax=Micromonospora sp. AMSO31t TaxID=2650566 RepID=UPI00124BC55C|nr:low temperature requirement protein A [Micromonospora sp. AMSO31t]KAB1914590.1 low temperature requirement protein A [Micromonospora sp. AMSO31t]
MTDGRGAELLRGGGGSHRATFLELFLDVVFVFAFTRVSQRLIDDVTTSGGRLPLELTQTLVLLLALWMVWSLTAWATSHYDPERPPIQAVMVGSMFGSLVMAVSVPAAYGPHGLSFAAGYVSIQLGRSLYLTVALRRHPQRHLSGRILVWSGVSAVLWLGGGLVGEDARLLCWAVALVIDYVGVVTGWPVPRLGRAAATAWTVTGEHLAERYQQFTIIALGEMIFVAGVGFSGSDFTLLRWIALIDAFATTVLLWRIYFHRAGSVLVEAVAQARQPARLGQSATWTHLTMIAGIVTTAVGYEVAISEPGGHADLVRVAAIVGGPALFVVGRARFEYEVFGRVSRSRVIGLLLLVLGVPLLGRLPLIGIAVGVTVVLTGMAVADALRARGRPPEHPASPM